MIDKAKIREFVEQQLTATDYFLVDVRVSADNRIEVEIDSPEGVDIDHCVALTRQIELEFDRDVEDYELEVGSAGLTSPFKVRAQYVKNLGNRVEVLTRDGRKLRGTLVEVSPDGEPLSFTIEVPTKVKHEGAKRPMVEPVATHLTADECKSVTYLIEF